MDRDAEACSAKVSQGNSCGGTTDAGGEDGDDAATSDGGESDAGDDGDSHNDATPLIMHLRSLYGMSTSRPVRFTRVVVVGGTTPWVLGGFIFRVCFIPYSFRLSLDFI
jgi:hypothetical protein